MNAAWSNENPEVITVLLKAGAEVNASADYGETPLMRAAEKNTNPEVITVLLKAGADVNAKNNGGKTALDIYAKEQRRTQRHPGDKGIGRSSESVTL